MSEYKEDGVCGYGRQIKKSETKERILRDDMVQGRCIQVGKKSIILEICGGEDRPTVWGKNAHRNCQVVPQE